jgi:hypothetical protein
LKRRQRHFLSPNAVHLFADNRIDIVEYTQAKR